MAQLAQQLFYFETNMCIPNSSKKNSGYEMIGFIKFCVVVARLIHIIVELIVHFPVYFSFPWLL